MAYGESNGHVTDDVTLPVADGWRCARLVEFAVVRLFSLYSYVRDDINTAEERR